MSVTIDDLLALAGRLDDGPGYDAPRERFRRFLLQHVTTPALARHLIEQCQHAPSEQHHRALQDLVVMTGRFLGFETTFGSYAPLAGAVRYDGQWQSRAKLQVVIEVRWDHLMTPGVETLLRSVSALNAATGARGARTAGLVVIVQPHSGRNRVEEAVAAAQSPHPLGTIGLRSLLLLADAVGAGGVAHDDVLRLIDGSLPIDFIVGMLERAQGKIAPTAAAAPASAGPGFTGHFGAAEKPHYWIAIAGPDHATRPEEFLDLVVGRRQIYGITGSPSTPHVVRPGDALCFFIAGKGIVGHARVGSIVENANVIRDAHRFRQLVHVEEVTLHTNDPWTLDDGAKLAMQAAGKATLIEITRENYRTLTVPRKMTVDAAPSTESTGKTEEAPTETQPSSETDAVPEAEKPPSKPPTIAASRRRR